MNYHFLEYIDTDLASNETVPLPKEAEIGESSQELEVEEKTIESNSVVNLKLDLQNENYLNG